MGSPVQTDDTMIEHQRSHDFIISTLRAEKARQGVTFTDLSERLKKLGVHQSATNLSSKFSTGTLSAQLFVLILVALDLHTLQIDPSLAD